MSIAQDYLRGDLKLYPVVIEWISFVGMILTSYKGTWSFNDTKAAEDGFFVT